MFNQEMNINVCLLLSKVCCLPLAPSTAHLLLSNFSRPSSSVFPLMSVLHPFYSSVLNLLCTFEYISFTVSIFPTECCFLLLFLFFWTFIVFLPLSFLYRQANMSKPKFLHSFMYLFGLAFVYLPFLPFLLSIFNCIHPPVYLQLSDLKLSIFCFPHRYLLLCTLLGHPEGRPLWLDLS